MKIKEFYPDVMRHKRQGFPEAIYAPGKTIKQIISVASKLLKGEGPVIVTRAEKSVYGKLKKKFPKAVYNESSKLVVLKKGNVPRSKGYICVVTAGTSDIPVAEESSIVADLLGARVERIYDVGVSGVHRLFKHHDKLVKAKCVIVCAGMEGALASVVGGLVGCPVIGVPTSVGYGVSFKGVSAMLTMLNSCAANVSVVNIDDGFGAGVIGSLIAKK
ncbi:MAG: nickel pincer cofactor biosynthesis protein LarB [Endomicrobiales bacterium]|nr:nickel pincer cofactor biosynthesis protein LarB [Endomicrobiales bacterium]